MKKKTYTVPAVKVVRLSHQYHLMANSVFVNETSPNASRTDYTDGSTDLGGSAKSKINWE